MDLAALTSPAVRALDRERTPIVLPVAAVEQHGAHLPVFTDSLLLEEVLRRVAGRVADRVVFAPLLWLGNSHHHLDFSGTLSAGPRTYLELLGDLIDNCVRHGFRRIVFVNGHGGNDVPGKQAVFEARQRHRGQPSALFLFATYWLLGGKPWEVDPAICQRQMGHACEWETSMILRLGRPVHGVLKELPPVEFGNAFEPATRGWVTQDRSAPGHIGQPHLASAAKGETLFRVFADDVQRLIERVLAWDGQSWSG